MPKEQFTEFPTVDELVLSEGWLASSPQEQFDAVEKWEQDWLKAVREKPVALDAESGTGTLSRLSPEGTISVYPRADQKIFETGNLLRGMAGLIPEIGDDGSPVMGKAHQEVVQKAAQQKLDEARQAKSIEVLGAIYDNFVGATSFGDEEAVRTEMNQNGGKPGDKFGPAAFMKWAEGQDWLGRTQLKNVQPERWAKAIDGLEQEDIDQVLNNRALRNYGTDDMFGMFGMLSHREDGSVVFNPNQLHDQEKMEMAIEALDVTGSQKERLLRQYKSLSEPIFNDMLKAHAAGGELDAYSNIMDPIASAKLLGNTVLTPKWWVKGNVTDLAGEADTGRLDYIGELMRNNGDAYGAIKELNKNPDFDRRGWFERTSVNLGADIAQRMTNMTLGMGKWAAAATPGKGLLDLAEGADVPGADFLGDFTDDHVFGALRDASNAITDAQVGTQAFSEVTGYQGKTEIFGRDFYTSDWTELGTQIGAAMVLGSAGGIAGSMAAGISESTAMSHSQKYAQLVDQGMAPGEARKVADMVGFVNGAITGVVMAGSGWGGGKILNKITGSKGFTWLGGAEGSFGEATGIQTLQGFVRGLAVRGGAKGAGKKFADKIADLPKGMKFGAQAADAAVDSMMGLAKGGLSRAGLGLGAKYGLEVFGEVAEETIEEILQTVAEFAIDTGLGVGDGKSWGRRWAEMDLVKVAILSAVGGGAGGTFSSGGDIISTLGDRKQRAKIKMKAAQEINSAMGGSSELSPAALTGERGDKGVAGIPGNIREARAEVKARISRSLQDQDARRNMEEDLSQLQAIKSRGLGSIRNIQKEQALADTSKADKAIEGEARGKEGTTIQSEAEKKVELAKKQKAKKAASDEKIAASNENIVRAHAKAESVLGKAPAGKKYPSNLRENQLGQKQIGGQTVATVEGNPVNRVKTRDGWRPMTDAERTAVEAEHGSAVQEASTFLAKGRAPKSKAPSAAAVKTAEKTRAVSKFISDIGEGTYKAIRDGQEVEVVIDDKGNAVVQEPGKPELRNNASTAIGNGEIEIQHGKKGVPTKFGEAAPAATGAETTNPDKPAKVADEVERNRAQDDRNAPASFYEAETREEAEKLIQTVPSESGGALTETVITARDAVAEGDVVDGETLTAEKAAEINESTVRRGEIGLGSVIETPGTEEGSSNFLQVIDMRHMPDGSVQYILDRPRAGTPNSRTEAVVAVLRGELGKVLKGSSNKVDLAASIEVAVRQIFGTMLGVSDIDSVVKFVTDTKGRAMRTTTTKNVGAYGRQMGPSRVNVEVNSALIAEDITNRILGAGLLQNASSDPTVLDHKMDTIAEDMTKWLEALAFHETVHVAALKEFSTGEVLSLVDSLSELLDDGNVRTLFENRLSGMGVEIGEDSDGITLGLIGGLTTEQKLQLGHELLVELAEIISQGSRESDAQYVMVRWLATLGTRPSRVNGRFLARIIEMARRMVSAMRRMVWGQSVLNTLPDSVRDLQGRLEKRMEAMNVLKPGDFEVQKALNTRAGQNTVGDIGSRFNDQVLNAQRDLRTVTTTLYNQAAISRGRIFQIRGGKLALTKAALEVIPPNLLEDATIAIDALNKSGRIDDVLEAAGRAQAARDVARETTAVFGRMDAGGVREIDPVAAALGYDSVRQLNRTIGGDVRTALGEESQKEINRLHDEVLAIRQRIFDLDEATELGLGEDVNEYQELSAKLDDLTKRAVAERAKADRLAEELTDLERRGTPNINDRNKPLPASLLSADDKYVRWGVHQIFVRDANAFFDEVQELSPKVKVLRDKIAKALSNTPAGETLLRELSVPERKMQRMTMARNEVLKGSVDSSLMALLDEGLLSEELLARLIRKNPATDGSQAMVFRRLKAAQIQRRADATFERAKVNLEWAIFGGLEPGSRNSSDMPLTIDKPVADLSHQLMEENRGYEFGLGASYDGLLNRKVGLTRRGFVARVNHMTKVKAKATEDLRKAEAQLKRLRRKDRRTEKKIEIFGYRALLGDIDEHTAILKQAHAALERVSVIINDGVGGKIPLEVESHGYLVSLMHRVQDTERAEFDMMKNDVGEDSAGLNRLSRSVMDVGPAIDALDAIFGIRRESGRGTPNRESKPQQAQMRGNASKMARNLLAAMRDRYYEGRGRMRPELFLGGGFPLTVEAHELESHGDTKTEHILVAADRLLDISWENTSDISQETEGSGMGRNREKVNRQLGFETVSDPKLGDRLGMLHEEDSNGALVPKVGMVPKMLSEAMAFIDSLETAPDQMTSGAAVVSDLLTPAGLAAGTLRPHVMRVAVLLAGHPSMAKMKNTLRTQFGEDAKVISMLDRLEEVEQFKDLDDNTRVELLGRSKNDEVAWDDKLIEAVRQLYQASKIANEIYKESLHNRTREELISEYDQSSYDGINNFPLPVNLMSSMQWSMDYVRNMLRANHQNSAIETGRVIAPIRATSLLEQYRNRSWEAREVRIVRHVKNVRDGERNRASRLEHGGPYQVPSAEVARDGATDVRQVGDTGLSRVIIETRDGDGNVEQETVGVEQLMKSVPEGFHYMLEPGQYLENSELGQTQEAEAQRGGGLEGSPEGRDWIRLQTPLMTRRGKAKWRLIALQALQGFDNDAVLTYVNQEKFKQHIDGATIWDDDAIDTSILEKLEAHAVEERENGMLVGGREVRDILMEGLRGEFNGLDGEARDQAVSEAKAKDQAELSRLKEEIGKKKAEVATVDGLIEQARTENDPSLEMELLHQKSVAEVELGEYETDVTALEGKDENTYTEEMHNEELMNSTGDAGRAVRAVLNGGATLVPAWATNGQDMYTHGENGGIWDVVINLFNAAGDGFIAFHESVEGSDADMRILRTKRGPVLLMERRGGFRLNDEKGILNELVQSAVKSPSDEAALRESLGTVLGPLKDMVFGGGIAFRTRTTSDLMQWANAHPEAVLDDGRQMGDLSPAEVWARSHEAAETIHSALLFKVEAALENSRSHLEMWNFNVDTQKAPLSELAGLVTELISSPNILAMVASTTRTEVDPEIVTSDIAASLAAKLVPEAELPVAGPDALAQFIINNKPANPETNAKTLDAIIESKSLDRLDHTLLGLAGRSRVSDELINIRDGNEQARLMMGALLQTVLGNGRGMDVANTVPAYRTSGMTSFDKIQFEGLGVPTMIGRALGDDQRRGVIVNPKGFKLDHPVVVDKFFDESNPLRRHFANTRIKRGMLAAARVLGNEHFIGPRGVEEAEEQGETGVKDISGAEWVVVINSTLADFKAKLEEEGLIDPVLDVDGNETGRTTYDEVLSQVRAENEAAAAEVNNLHNRSTDLHKWIRTLTVIGQVIGERQDEIGGMSGAEFLEWAEDDSGMLAEVKVKGVKADSEGMNAFTQWLRLAADENDGVVDELAMNFVDRLEQAELREDISAPVVGGAMARTPAAIEQARQRVLRNAGHGFTGRDTPGYGGIMQRRERALEALERTTKGQDKEQPWFNLWDTLRSIREAEDALLGGGIDEAAHQEWTATDTGSLASEPQWYSTISDPEVLENLQSLRAQARSAVANLNKEMVGWERKVDAAFGRSEGANADRSLWAGESKAEFLERVGVSWQEEGAQRPRVLSKVEGLKLNPAMVNPRNFRVEHHQQRFDKIVGRSLDAVNLRKQMVTDRILSESRELVAGIEGDFDIKFPKTMARMISNAVSEITFPTDGTLAERIERFRQARINAASKAVQGAMPSEAKAFEWAQLARAKVGSVLTGVVGKGDYSLDIGKGVAPSARLAAESSRLVGQIVADLQDAGMTKEWAERIALRELADVSHSLGRQWGNEASEIETKIASRIKQNAIDARFDGKDSNRKINVNTSDGGSVISLVGTEEEVEVARRMLHQISTDRWVPAYDRLKPQSPFALGQANIEMVQAQVDQAFAGDKTAIRAVLGEPGQLVDSALHTDRGIERVRRSMAARMNRNVSTAAALDRIRAISFSTQLNSQGMSQPAPDSFARTSEDQNPELTKKVEEETAKGLSNILKHIDNHDNIDSVEGQDQFDAVKERYKNMLRTIVRFRETYGSLPRYRAEGWSDRIDSVLDALNGELHTDRIPQRDPGMSDEDFEEAMERADEIDAELQGELQGEENKSAISKLEELHLDVFGVIASDISLELFQSGRTWNDLSPDEQENTTSPRNALASGFVGPSAGAFARFFLHEDATIRSMFARNLQGIEAAQELVAQIEYGLENKTGRNGYRRQRLSFGERLTKLAVMTTGTSTVSSKVGSVVRKGLREGTRSDFESLDATTRAATRNQTMGYVFATIIERAGRSHSAYAPSLRAEAKNILEELQMARVGIEESRRGTGMVNDDHVSAPLRVARAAYNSVVGRKQSDGTRKRTKADFKTALSGWKAMRHTLFSETHDLEGHGGALEAVRETIGPVLEAAVNGDFESAADPVLAFNEALENAVGEDAAAFGNGAIELMEELRPSWEATHMMEASGRDPRNYPMLGFRWRKFMKDPNAFGREGDVMQEDIVDSLKLDRASIYSGMNGRDMDKIQMLDFNGLRAIERNLDDMLYRINVAPAYRAVRRVLGHTQVIGGNVKFVPEKVNGKEVGDGVGSLARRATGEVDEKVLRRASAFLSHTVDVVVNNDISGAGPSNRFSEAVNVLGGIGMALSLISASQVWRQTLSPIIGYGLFRGNNANILSHVWRYGKSGTRNLGYNMAKQAGLDRAGMNVEGWRDEFSENLDALLLSKSPYSYVRGADGINDLVEMYSGTSMGEAFRPEFRGRLDKIVGGSLRHLGNMGRYGRRSIEKGSKKGLDFSIAKPEKLVVRMIFANELLKAVNRRLASKDNNQQQFDLEYFVNHKELWDIAQPTDVETAKTIVQDMMAQGDTSKKAGMFQRRHRIWSMVAPAFVTFSNHIMSTSANSTAAGSMMWHGDKKAKIEGARLLSSAVAQNTAFVLADYAWITHLIGALIGKMGGDEEEWKRRTIPQFGENAMGHLVARFLGNEKKPWGYEKYKGAVTERGKSQDAARMQSRMASEITQQIPILGLLFSNYQGSQWLQEGGLGWPGTNELAHKFNDLPAPNFNRKAPEFGDNWVANTAEWGVDVGGEMAGNMGGYPGLAVNRFAEMAVVGTHGGVPDSFPLAAYWAMYVTGSLVGPREVANMGREKIVDEAGVDMWESAYDDIPKKKKKRGRGRSSRGSRSGR